MVYVRLTPRLENRNILILETLRERKINSIRWYPVLFLLSENIVQQSKLNNEDMV